MDEKPPLERNGEANGSLLCLVLTLPQPWPPARDVSIISGPAGIAHFELIATPEGTLRVRIESVDQTIYTEFQPMDLVGGGFGILMLSWSGGFISLKFDNQAISPKSHNSQKIRITSRNNKKLIEPEAFPPSAMILDRAERFFVDTLVDISTKMSGDVYDAIKSSGLLRLVLLDGLLAKANRNHRLKLRFYIIDHHFLDFVDTQWQTLLPSSLVAPSKVLEVGLDKLFCQPILKYRGAEISVRELIRACANAAGGVHFGQAEADEQPLLDWNDVFRLLGKEPSAAALNDLCRVVLNGLMPLVRQIGASTVNNR